MLPLLHNIKKHTINNVRKNQTHVIKMKTKLLTTGKMLI
jgi:hypothetical protein